MGEDKIFEKYFFVCDEIFRSDGIETKKGCHISNHHSFHAYTPKSSLKPVTKKALEEYLGLNWIDCGNRRGLLTIKNIPHEWYIFDLDVRRYKTSLCAEPCPIPDDITTKDAFYFFAENELLKKMFDIFDLDYFLAVEKQFWKDFIAPAKNENIFKIGRRNHILVDGYPIGSDDVTVSIYVDISTGYRKMAGFVVDIKVFTDASPDSMIISIPITELKEGLISFKIHWAMEELGMRMNMFNVYFGDDIKNVWDFSSDFI